MMSEDEVTRRLRAANLMALALDQMTTEKLGGEVVCEAVVAGLAFVLREISPPEDLRRKVRIVGVRLARDLKIDLRVYRGGEPKPEWCSEVERANTKIAAVTVPMVEDIGPLNVLEALAFHLACVAIDCRDKKLTTFEMARAVAHDALDRALDDAITQEQEANAAG